MRTTPEIDVVEYPDSGKINILPNQEMFEVAAKVNYYLGEDRIAEK